MNDYAISSKILADNGVMPERISAFLLWRMLVTRSSDNQYFDWACSDFETGEMLGFVRTDLYGYPCGQTGDGSFHFEIGAVVQRLVVCESLPLMADYLATKPEDNCCFLLAHEAGAVREAMECYGAEIQEILLYYSFRKPFLREIAEAFPTCNMKAYCVHG